MLSVWVRPNSFLRYIMARSSFLSIRYSCWKLNTCLRQWRKAVKNYFREVHSISCFVYLLRQSSLSWKVI